MTRWIPLSLRKPTQGLYRDEHPVNRDKLILAVAASGCSTSHRLPSHSLDDDSFRRLLRQAAQQRLIGILGSVVEAGTFAVTDEQLELLAESEQEWAVQAVLVERLLLEIADLLDEGGVPYRVLKGPALAWTAYPDPEAEGVCRCRSAGCRALALTRLVRFSGTGSVRNEPYPSCVQASIESSVRKLS